MKRLPLLLIALFMCSVFALSQSVADLVVEADGYSTVSFENQKALDKLLQAEKMDANNFGVLWRISRSYVDIGEHLPNKTLCL